MIALGIDPDTKNTGIALVRAVGADRPPEVLWVGVAAVKASLPVEQRIIEMVGAIDRALVTSWWPEGGMFDVVVVEGQDAYAGTKRHARPNDLIHLAQVAGIALTSVRRRWPDWAPSLTHIPKPALWKKQIKKDVHHARILGRVGAVRWGDIRESHRSHVIDAIGLALWGLEQAKAPMPRVRRYGG